MPATLAATRYSHGHSVHDMSTTSKEKSLALHLKTLHQKASRALILGQNSAAWEHSRAAIEHCTIERLTNEYGEQQARQLCCRLWILYICVVSSVAEVAEKDGSLRVKHGVDGTKGVPESVRSVWNNVVKAFGGCAGDVDSEVLVPTVLLCLKLRDARTARDIVEAWLATLSDETMRLLHSAQSVNGAQQIMASYVRVCELYMLHVLPQLGDLESAYEFLSVSTVVSDQVKCEFTKRLDALRNPPVLTRKRKAVKSKKSRKPKLVQSPVDDVAKPVAETQTEKHVSTRNDLPALATLAPRSTKIGVRRQAKAGTLVRRPRSTLSVAWHVVRRLMSRWGFTLFTLAVAVAVIRMLTQRFRVPPFFTAVYRKLWNTVKMGTQVTYI
ncbi:hypothetical protein GGH12_004707 [Coemansia sp. RSA 1822]|nr:hypothetical protein LPJ76_004654 [Coemansia sp. RSA 638]KAJ2120856.1 hypothetical protein IW147_004717 [Coemansia sp. RSA 720]KAJ2560564.1 hypothetical protein GGH12_004707 [Coemansia sp. RSA 1822]